MHARVIAGVAAAVVAAMACGPKRTGTGTGTGTGVGSGTGTGSGSADVAPVVVDWSKAGVDWDKVPEPGAEPAFQPPVPVTFTLVNGVKVVLVENHRLPLVSIRVINTRAGAREQGAATGLSSLVADLLDEGAGKLDAFALPEAIEQLGANLDTAIAEDASTVALETLASTLDASLALLADVVQRPRLSEEDFDRVKADTIEELKQRPDEPRRVANLVFDRVVLGDHPYAEPAQGYVATVEKLTLRDAKAFWKKHYVPSAATIVVAGDVDRKKLEAMLADSFGGWKGKKLRAGKPPAAAKVKPRSPGLYVVDRPRAPQSVVMIGRAGMDTSDPRYFASEVINTAVGGSFAARLNNRLREQLGYTYGMFSGFWRGEWGGTWAVSSSLKTNVTVAGIEEALKILAAARSEDVPAEEWAKAQQLMTRATPQDFETNSGIAGQFSTLVVQRLPLDWHQRWVDLVRKVAAADGRKVAADAWTDLSIVVVGDWTTLGKDLERLGLPITRLDAEGVALDKK